MVCGVQQAEAYGAAAEGEPLVALYQQPLGWAADLCCWGRLSGGSAVPDFKEGMLVREDDDDVDGTYQLRCVEPSSGICVGPWDDAEEEHHVARKRRNG